MLFRLNNEAAVASYSYLLALLVVFSFETYTLAQDKLRRQLRFLSLKRWLSDSDLLR